MELKFQQLEEDPNLEVIEFESKERYLIRHFDPDEPSEIWTYHRKGHGAIQVYRGGIIPKSMIKEMILLTLEGLEFPYPEIEEISKRIKS